MAAFSSDFGDFGQRPQDISSPLFCLWASCTLVPCTASCSILCGLSVRTTGQEGTGISTRLSLRIPSGTLWLQEVCGGGAGDHGKDTYTYVIYHDILIYLFIYIYTHSRVYICCIATILAAALNCDSITKLGSSQFRVRFRCTWKAQSCLKWNQRIWLLPSNVDPMTCTQTDGLQTLVLDLSCRVLRIAQLFMGYTQSFIHLLDSKNCIFLFPTAVTGFQCLGLGVMRHFVPSSKTGTEAQHWNPGALEPSVGLQNLVNYPQDKLLSITKCQHRLVSIS